MFAAGAALSAGAAATGLAPLDEAAPARRLALAGAFAELALTALMEQRLGELGEPYRQGAAGRFAQLARALTGAGAAVLVIGRRRRGASVIGSAILLAGALAERFGVFRAGFQSASDPKFTVGPQRERVAADGGHGASARVTERSGT